MKNVGKAGVAALGACLTVTAGWSVPAARAEPVMEGAYIAHYANGTNRWTISTHCEVAGCFAHIVSSSGWSRDAQFSGERWNMVWIGRPDGFVCPDGTTAPATVTWWWEAASLVGTVSADYGAGCGNPPVPPGHSESPFSLTKSY